jgi:hypothetical protein
MTKRQSAGDLLVRSLQAELGENMEFDPREIALLQLAKSQADDITTLEALLREQGASVIGSTGNPRLSPIFSELRQSRLTLSRILGQIKMPDEGLGVSKNAIKSRAAQVRWSRQKGL